MLLACLSQVLVSGGLAVQQAAIQAGVLPLLLAPPCQDKATLLQHLLQLPEGIEALLALVQQGPSALAQLAAMCDVAPSQAYTALLRVCQHVLLQPFASQVRHLLTRQACLQL
jgi:hypothetical protein